MNKSTDVSIASHYQTQGFFLPLDAVPPEMAQDAVERIDALSEPDSLGLDHPWNLKSHLLFDWIYALATHSRVLDAVEAAVGPDILLEGADIFAKPPHGSKHVNWHQDANYWGLEPFGICTGWIALTDATLENGCMRFLPGTHLKQKIEHIETFAADSDLTRGQEIALDINEDETVPVILKQGQMSLHHCLLAHASGPNRTDQPRIGLAIRYLSPQVRQTDGPPMSVILVRGSDRYGHFVMDQPPVGDCTPADIAAHDQSMRPHAASLYATA